VLKKHAKGARERFLRKNLKINEIIAFKSQKVIQVLNLPSHRESG